MCVRVCLEVLEVLLTPNPDQHSALADAPRFQAVPVTKNNAR